MEYKRQEIQEYFDDLSDVYFFDNSDENMRLFLTHSLDKRIRFFVRGFFTR